MPKITEKYLCGLIVQAHDNLTYKMGRREYAPDVHEIQKEVNKLHKNKLDERKGKK